LKITFPLLSDQGLHTTRKYNILAPNKVTPTRSFFLVDEQGILRRQWLLGIAGDDIVFASEPILKAIEELKSKA
jgi:alkyl hydroperoxide reductase subunit AhpC